jgi:cystine transport system permease protein
MSWGQTLWYAVLPQAARVATPPLANSFISLVKDTSLAAAITVTEMFQEAQRIAADNYEPLILYSEAALLYLVVCTVLSAAQGRLELRLGRHLDPLVTT